MTSWRLDSNEREVGAGKKAGQASGAPPPPPPPRKSGQDDEYDFGAGPPKQVSTSDRSTSQSSGSSSTSERVQTDELFDPFKYSLKRVHLKRNAGQPLGMDVASSGSGVVKVIGVAEGGPAQKAGVEKDSYLVSIDGSRVTSDNDVKNIETGPRRGFRMAFAQKRQSSLDSASFALPGSAPRKAGNQYFLFRIDPTNGVRVGIGIGNRDNQIYVSQVLDKSAGQKAGVRVGDRMLAVDDSKIENQDNCKALVQKSMGNPFDLVVERAPLIAKPAPPPAPAPAPTPPPPPPPVDPDAGDPSLGVPQVPVDVSHVLLDTRARKAVFSVRHTKKSRATQPKENVDRSHRVKLSKAVKSTKLHKPK